MTTYETPRVTFAGSDPKIPALRKAAQRIARHSTDTIVCRDSWSVICYVERMKAANRRTRVLMRKVQRENA